MSTANTKNGSAIEPRAAQDDNAPAPAHAPPPAYARIKGSFLPKSPILTQKPSPKVPEKWADGRIISQALSIKLVFGVGLGLVIGAILPFVFGKASRPGPAVKELPAWSNNGGSTGTAEQHLADHGADMAVFGSGPRNGGCSAADRARPRRSSCPSRRRLATLGRWP